MSKKANKKLQIETPKKSSSDAQPVEDLHVASTLDLTGETSPITNEDDDDEKEATGEDTTGGSISKGSGKSNSERNNSSNATETLKSGSSIEKEKIKVSTEKQKLPPAKTRPVTKSEAKEKKKVITSEEGPVDIHAKLQSIFHGGAGQQKVETYEKMNRSRLIYFNTYQLGPIKKFSPVQVKRCILETFSDVLKGVKYNSSKAIAITGTVAEIIRDRVLELQYDRCKIIVLVTIGPMGRQGVEIGFKCLWDATRDNYAHAIFQNYHIYASACVYGIYLD